MRPFLFQEILAVIHRYWRSFAKAALMISLSNAFLIANPLVLRQAVLAMDSSFQHLEGRLGRFLEWLLGSHIHSLFLWAVLLISITVISAFFKYRMRLCFIEISREEELKVRSALFDKIQGQSMAFFDRHRVGEVMSRLTNDISTYRDVLGPGIMYPTHFLTLACPALFALFTISEPLALLSLFPLILLPILILRVETKVFSVSKEVQQSLGDMSTAAHESFSAIRTVKSYGIENRLLHRFCRLCKKFISLNMRWAVIEGLFFPLLVFITRASTALLVLFSGVIILRGWSELSAADFISFMWLQTFIYGPVLMLGWILPIYIKGAAAYSRLVEIYNEPDEVQDCSSKDILIPEKAGIQCENLNFCYPSSLIPTLSQVKIDIQGGQFVAITGPIGAGKTTLFRLLMRDYEIPFGMIKIGGKDIHEYPLQVLRDSLAIVEQQPFLFSNTIEENVLFAREDVTKQELDVVIEHADLHKTLLELPEKIHTLVGERGMMLSGGQKQRVALARALLSNRSIILLDDIFSAVDATTAENIFQSIKKHFSGKTVLLITHRLSILEKMDRVIYMKKGTVVEDGTPQKLKERHSHYTALIELQRQLQNSCAP